MDKDSTKIFFMKSLGFMERKTDRITFHEYCAFLINELIDMGYELAEIIEWLIEWVEDQRKE